MFCTKKCKGKIKWLTDYANRALVQSLNLTIIEPLRKMNYGICIHVRNMSCKIHDNDLKMAKSKSMFLCYMSRLYVCLYKSMHVKPVVFVFLIS